MPERRKIPAVPSNQALRSTTFQLPPLDGSLSIPELIDYNAIHSPNHRFFVFPKDDGTLMTVTWADAGTAVHRCVKLVRDKLSWAPNQLDVPAPVIGILAHSDALPYLTTVLGIFRAGYTVFTISPRNSPAAVAALLNAVGVTLLLEGHDPGMKNLVKESLDLLKSDYPSAKYPHLAPLPTYGELYESELVVSPSTIPFEFPGPDASLLILHTSGSVAHPKPVHWSHHRYLQLGLMPFFGEQDLTGMVTAAHGAPFFHGLGLCQIPMLNTLGVVLSSYRPHAPLAALTPDGLLQGVKDCGSDLILCVPAFLEAWSRNPEQVSFLQGLNGGIQFAGGPLHKDTGNFMVSKGIKIFDLYGTSETGLLSLTLPAAADEDWDWLRFPKSLPQQWIPQGNDLYELAVMRGELYEPCVINITIDGVEGYATSDLFEKHPSKEGRWRVYGRSDDQIMHSTGEKTNPVHIERILGQDPNILGVVMFGRERFQAGLLVDPKPHLRFDPADKEKLAEFRNLIWPTVEKANQWAPQHSRLFKEFIIVSDPKKPWIYTTKLLPRRQTVVQDYEAEIDAMYQEVELSTQSYIAPPTSWDLVSATDFVRAVIDSVLKLKLNNDDDFFNHGCDSLQATWIRNSLLHGLRTNAMIDTRGAPRNFVYDFPTVNSLSKHLLDLATGRVGDKQQTDTVADTMRISLEKHTEQYPARPQKTPTAPDSHVVLLTGSTGSLGSYILARLFNDANVGRVISLNRRDRSGKALLERQKESFVHRGLDPIILESERIELYEGDLSLPNFGLDVAVYGKIHSSVTLVIHNAWTVDFNLALPSFEPNIKGVRGLIDFALTSPLEPPPHITFVSSIGVVSAAPEDKLYHEEPADINEAQANGYTQSKWVAEGILADARDRTALSPAVVRVGQLTGGFNGAWNVAEWLPSIVQSGTVVRCFPDDDKLISWIPVHTAADVLVEVALATAMPSSRLDYGHLVHPRPVAWSTLASVFASELRLPLVTFKEWKERLEALDSDKHGDKVELLRNIPALKLLDMIQFISSQTGGEALGLPRVSTDKIRSRSPTLAGDGLAQLMPDDVHVWLGYWRRVGLLK